MIHNVEKCPNCGSSRIDHTMNQDSVTSDLTFGVMCLECDFRVFGFDSTALAVNAWNIEALKGTVDKKEDNPYTELASEMRLLNYALEDANLVTEFRAAVMGGMAPIIWEKLEAAKARDFLHKTLNIPEDAIKKLNEEHQKREDEKWAKARKEAGF